MCSSAPSFFGLPDKTHPKLNEICSERKKALYRELYELVVYGKVGGYEVARRMPRELRRFWVEQVLADREEERKQAKR